ncbi:MAG: alkaline phosphatase family protein [Deltaproteobacteria bacterium]|nr:alkaline phosphatase family protein [Deltaproteobacteria bacterium]
MTKTTRREFVKRSSAVAATFAVAGALPMRGILPKSRAPYLRNPNVAKKFIILGMDGMDPVLVRQFIEEGHLPTFAKLMQTSHFGALRTTMPPQSPVAWSSFITGTNPGGHGIFDFIHRDPTAFAPYLSTSRSFGSNHSLDLGKWSVPLGSGRVDLMRKGRPFWSYLDEQQIPAVVHQIPANFPVIESPTKAVSGMGTPDLLGSYGTFTYFSEAHVEQDRDFSAARIVRLRLQDHTVKTKLEGPKNSFRNDGADTETEVTFTRDPQDQLVTISVQGQTLLMKKGEWSDWVPLRFEYIPHLMTAPGMVRFYVKDVHPKLKIYCSPINVDPVEPALPIVSPPAYGQELAKNIGRFYTQGLPADTKALSLKILDDEEFFAQAKLVLEESMRGLEYGLKQFHEGVFFHYFSSIDQCSHMLMRTMDVNHPQYNPNASPEIKNAIRYLYSRMDDALAETLKYVDSQTVLVALSDHGFSQFYREFHLSTWLVQQGYTVLTDPSKMTEQNFFDYVDWSKTKAYAIGFNGLYINRQGREKNGAISDLEAQAIKAELIQKLPQVKDPQTGNSVIVAAYDSTQIYSGPFTALAPDILVGYHAGYRVSDESALGKFGKEICELRTDKWSADHCIDQSVVPGMLLMNRPCVHPAPGLWDLAPTILESFSIPTPSTMNGKSLLSA